MSEQVCVTSVVCVQFYKRTRQINFEKGCRAEKRSEREDHRCLFGPGACLRHVRSFWTHPQQLGIDCCRSGCAEVASRRPAFASEVECSLVGVARLAAFSKYHNSLFVVAGLTRRKALGDGCVVAVGEWPGSADENKLTGKEKAHSKVLWSGSFERDLLVR